MESRMPSLLRAVALVAVAVPAICRALDDAVVNGSFENGLQPWTTRGGTDHPVVRLTSAGRDGAQALRAEGRTAAADGVQQDVTAALGTAGSGAQFTSRLWIRLDAPASVRLLVRLGPVPRPVILAERIVRVQDEWVLVQGTARLRWDGELAQATVYTEVAQVPERRFPAYTLDAVSVQPDTDGDQCTEAEEATIGTDPQRRDSDGDGMPDGWERTHGFDPRVADGAGDSDGDSFTNQQEYGAATDPRAATSFPGKPANPNMNPTARALLRYLALLPTRPERRVVVGQHITETDPEYETQVVALERQTGKWPALLSVQYEGQREPLQVATANRCALNYWEHGGLVKIKWRPHDPWTGSANYRRPSRGQPDWVDLPGLLVPAQSSRAADVAANQRAHEVYSGWLTAVAAGLRELRAAGVVVLWRPCSEMNGGWFWWGRRPQRDYVALWRHQFHYLTVEQGLDNLIWVYESASAVHDLVPADYYYPGDDVVDVVGHNLYDKTWDLPFDANGLYRDYPKVYGIPQAGTAHGQGKSTDGTWDNLTYITQIRARYPRCSFFAVWNSFVTGGGQTAVRLGLADNPHAAELFADPWIVTRDRLDWRPGDH